MPRATAIGADRKSSLTSFVAPNMIPLMARTMSINPKLVSPEEATPAGKACCVVRLTTAPAASAAVVTSVTVSGARCVKNKNVLTVTTTYDQNGEDVSAGLKERLPYRARTVQG